MLNAAQGKDTGDNCQPGGSDEEAELEDLRARYSSIPVGPGFGKRVSSMYDPVVAVGLRIPDNKPKLSPHPAPRGHLHPACALGHLSSSTCDRM